jgi:hypothetical protein
MGVKLDFTLREEHRLRLLDWGAEEDTGHAR